MRSPTDAGRRARRALEWGCRAGALALLGWAIAAELRGATATRPAPVVLRGDASIERLAAAAYAPVDAPVHAELGGAPDATVRAWLRALARSGHRVSWSGRFPATAVGAEAVAEPGGGVRIAAAVPAGSLVRIADDAGAIDSAQVRAAGLEVRVPAVEGRARAAVGSSVATSARPDSVLLRDVVVAGRPSWETRFVATALEEAGWRVSLRTPVAPGQVVQQGSIALDTSRVGAVVALDSTAAVLGESLARFVRAGGGLVAAPAAVRELPSVAALVPGRAGGRAAPIAVEGDSMTRALLAFSPIVTPRADAVVLERRGGAVAVAARRVGSGRVAQLGYEESWRWRMSGGDSGAVAHRRWWSALVASVAHAPAVRLPPDAREADPAPLAATIGALGAPAAGPPAVSPLARVPRLGPLALAVLFALLLVEWVSRRLRGAR